MLASYSPVSTRTGVAGLTSSREDPFVVYARSLHEYTLQLWTESIRTTQEKKQRHAVAKAEKKAAAQKTRQREAQVQSVQNTQSVSEEKGAVKSSA